MENKNNINISYKLVKVKILSYSVLYFEDIILGKRIPNFTFEISGAQIIREETKTIDVMTTVKVFLEPDKKELAGEIKTLNQFEIFNYNEVLKGKNNTANIPKEFLATILGLSISNTRGMMIAKSTGTILENAILPILNPFDIIKNIFKDQKHGT